MTPLVTFSALSNNPVEVCSALTYDEVTGTTWCVYAKSNEVVAVISAAVFVAAVSVSDFWVLSEVETTCVVSIDGALVCSTVTGVLPLDTVWCSPT